MKRFFYSAMVFAAILATSCTKEDKGADENSIISPKEYTSCLNNIEAHLEREIEANPKYLAEIERMNGFIDSLPQEDLMKSTKTITIPVAVHIVYNTDEQNITWGQVKSQIDVLNKDFNAENDDIGEVPAPFKKRVADVGINFELKHVTRTETHIVQFKDDPKTKGGIPEVFDICKKGKGKKGMDPKKYLNIWVGNLPDGIGGVSVNLPIVLDYPQYDGILVDYKFFGTKGTVYDHSKYGRVATHEVGHWLNLLHVWGLGNGDCSKDDYVDDTPKQNGAWTGCSYPNKTCNTVDMSMNYMQYNDGHCIYMFTKGQKARMRANFEPGGYRDTFN